MTIHIFYNRTDIFIISFHPQLDIQYICAASYHVTAHGSPAISPTHKHVVRLLCLVDHSDVIVAILNDKKIKKFKILRSNLTNMQNALLFAIDYYIIIHYSL